jgi:hypothetical protein
VGTKSKNVRSRAVDTLAALADSRSPTYEKDEFCKETGCMMLEPLPKLT